jgi:hypothetical protein
MSAMASPDECGQLLYQAALFNNVDLLTDLLSGDFVQQLEWRDPNVRPFFFLFWILSEKYYFMPLLRFSIISPLQN